MAICSRAVTRFYIRHVEGCPHFKAHAIAISHPGFQRCQCRAVMTDVLDICHARSKVLGSICRFSEWIMAWQD